MPVQPLAQTVIVTAAEMQQIESRIFAAGMPIAALMEKVALRMCDRLIALYPTRGPVGVLVGPGHNGGDALVVARELLFRGYQPRIYCPFERLKDLTQTHVRYCDSLGIPRVANVLGLQDCDWLVDGWFGFGLERSLSDSLIADIQTLNEWAIPIVSIDVPSGLHTDTGQVLPIALRATHTLCLGLWKRGLLQDHALEWIGHIERIDFDIPNSDIQAVLGAQPRLQRISPEQAIAQLPLTRPLATHKYKMGHVLLIAGSRQYGGAAILAGLAARASGVGMLSIAVPESIKALITAQLPDAIVWGCPETPSGAIADLPDSLNLSRYDAIACGPGLTQNATSVVEAVIQSDRPLILDADGLNILAASNPNRLVSRALTILTPHDGEFQRLFPTIARPCRILATQQAAQTCGAIIVLKGARVTIATPSGQTSINPASSPALARGGSGDILTGLMGGLLAQQIRRQPENHNTSFNLDSFDLDRSIQEGFAVAQAATGWQAQAGILAAQARSLLGVDAVTLTQWLIPALMQTWPRSSRNPTTAETGLAGAPAHDGGSQIAPD